MPLPLKPSRIAGGDAVAVYAVAVYAVAVAVYAVAVYAVAVAVAVAVVVVVVVEAPGTAGGCRCRYVVAVNPSPLTGEDVSAKRRQVGVSPLPLSLLT